MQPQFFTAASGRQIAYSRTLGEGPGVLFCSGYRSDMFSTKATVLAEWCAAQNVPFTRFDYNGHGKSEGDFKDFTIGGAMQDALEVVDEITSGPQIIVGSSMGSWVALNVALERKAAIKGFIGIASAPDFTERLMVPRMSAEQRREMDEHGLVWVPSDFGAPEYPITQHFLHEARNHLILDDVLGLDIPIHLFHGQMDVDVPWETSVELAKQVMSDEVVVTLIKDGDHRLNRPADMQLVLDALARMLATL